MLHISARKNTARPLPDVRLVSGAVRQPDAQAGQILLLHNHLRDHAELQLQDCAGLFARLQQHAAAAARHPIQHTVARRAQQTLQDAGQNLDHRLHEIPVHTRHAHHCVQVFPRDCGGAQCGARESHHDHLVHVQVYQLFRVGLHHLVHLPADRDEHRQACMRAHAAQSEPAAHTTQSQTNLFMHHTHRVAVFLLRTVCAACRRVACDLDQEFDKE